MRASRLVSLLLHLQTRGQLTAGELAERLEVSERTVQRDVDALVEAGVPVRSVRGPAGGYRLAGGYRTRLTGLTEDEAQALSFVGLAGPADDLGLGGALAAAQLKLQAALSGEARERSGRAQTRFHLDLPRWYASPEPTPSLATLAGAVWDDRRVRVGYRENDGVVRRTLDPLGLVLKAGQWYLVARRRRRLRTYRVSRIAWATVLDARFHRPENFDLAATWQERQRALEAQHQRTEVTLRIDAAALWQLRRIVAPEGQATVDAVPRDSERPQVTVPFEGAGWAAAALLALGPAVQVLAPAHVRTSVASRAREVAELYPTEGGGNAP